MCHFINWVCYRMLIAGLRRLSYLWGPLTHFAVCVFQSNARYQEWCTQALRLPHLNQWTLQLSRYRIHKTLNPNLLFRYQEWYTRTLRNGYTHVSVPDDDSMCNDTWAKVCCCLSIPAHTWVMKPRAPRLNDNLSVAAGAADGGDGAGAGCRHTGSQASAALAAGAVPLKPADPARVWDGPQAGRGERLQLRHRVHPIQLMGARGV